MDVKYILALSFTEFQVLYKYGGLNTHSTRLIPFDLSEKAGIPLQEKLAMDSIIPFDLEDEHDVVIAKVNPNWNGTGSEYRPPDSLHPAMCFIPISSIQSFHALSDRGMRILKTRVSGIPINIEPPLFPNAAAEHWKQRASNNALMGSTHLLKLIVGNNDYSPSNQFIEASLKALEMLNNHQEYPLPSGTLLENVMCYTRHKPWPDDDLSFIRDIGLILNQKCSDNGVSDKVLDGLRAFTGNHQGKNEALHTLLGSKELPPVFTQLQSTMDLQYSLYGIILFLSLKHQYMNSQKLNIDDLMRSLVLYVDVIPRDDFFQAIWLYGLYLGFERLVPDYYCRYPREYPFILKKDIVSHRPIKLKKANIPKQTKKTTSRPKKSVKEKEVQIETKTDAENSSPELKKEHEVKDQVQSENKLTQTIPEQKTTPKMPKADESHISEKETTSNISEEESTIESGGGSQGDIFLTKGGPDQNNKEKKRS